MEKKFAERIRRAQELVANQEWGGLVVGTGPELAYFINSWTSSHERLTALVISASSAVVIAPITDVAQLEREVGSDVEIRSFRDGQDPYAMVAELVGRGQIGLGSSLSAPHVLGIQRAVAGETSLLPAGLFQVKEDEEIAFLREAAEAIDAVHAQVPALLRAGRTEREIADELHELILKEHVEVDFVIVGSGPNGADPHHSFSDRVLQPGDPVVIDLGGRMPSGYRSDCTRTHVVPGGNPPAEFERAYEAVHKAYRAAIDAVRPGIRAEELDAVAREIIESYGLGEYFTHRLGHGIGMSTHEEPYLLSGNEQEIARNMAFSIEPGVYVPGEWGVRIEDIVVVADEAIRLNLQPTKR
ncbi:M24 family metallopeptidase [Corynebacterium tapiri]|uniref:M24 family metallopeptidase n=1 Tax=Corynebacterium tapiri TaxID=1448266 RepID=A0A5C4U3G3_9CORY|nr:M24 family metallopeptidase [Corynebacterium tapiri]TNL97618.1 M24 family metallopeptidase [Corynebacterium tapiri]